MAKKVILSLRAEKERLAILEYYFNETNSNKVPNNLYQKISGILDTISDFPYSGKIFNNKGHRALSKPPYSIIYKISKEYIEVLNIWDSRRNPVDLKL
jgi:plasmid stabilization system protein ParE